MCRKSASQARVNSFTLVVALAGLLAPAVATQAQTGICEPAGDGSPAAFFDDRKADTEAPAGISPAQLALADIAGTATPGGLWLTGDSAGGLAYLRWTAGNQPTGLLEISREGKVSFNLKALAAVAGTASESTDDQRASIASFVKSDEGLRLLAEVTSGPYRFLLHLGPSMPTRAGDLRNDGTRVLDNRFDSRVNPLRRDGQKLDRERPPKGLDALVAINTDVIWFNLYNQKILPLGQLIFHELAEAHARLVLDLDYLPQGNKPGAHDVAIAREIQLKQQRPGLAILMPIGRNLMVVSRDDKQRLFAKLRKQNNKEAFKAYE